MTKRKKYYVTIDRNGTEDELCVHAPDGRIMASTQTWHDVDTDGQAQADIKLIVDALNAYKREAPAAVAHQSTNLPTRFDDYEVHGIREFGKGRFSYAEPVADDEAQFWSLFGHITGHGLECIGDFKTREDAEKVYARITGRHYGSPS